MPELVAGGKALALVLDRHVCSKLCTTVKCTLYREITCTLALERIPVRYGQPLQGLDKVGMGWTVGMGMGPGVTENKSKVVGGRIKVIEKGWG